MNKVHVLCKGYSRPDTQDARITHANGSCTLVQTFGGMNIIVDTLTSWDGERLCSYLAAHNLRPQDIHLVVCTHGHSDHIGCNYLFLKARWHFVGNTLSWGDEFLDWDTAKPYNIPGTLQQEANEENDSVQVLYTPGHTKSCVSLLVRDTALGTVGICGDLFEREADIWDANIWQGAGSEDPQQQILNRSKMIELCDHIVPGHGEMFKVTEAMRDKLKEEAKLLLEGTAGGAVNDSSSK